MIRIKNANKLPASDLRKIARFFRIIKNYLKIENIQNHAHKKN